MLFVSRKNFFVYALIADFRQISQYKANNVGLHVLYYCLILGRKFSTFKHGLLPILRPTSHLSEILLAKWVQRLNEKYKRKCRIAEEKKLNFTARICLFFFCLSLAGWALKSLTWKKCTYSTLNDRLSSIQ